MPQSTSPKSPSRIALPFRAEISDQLRIARVICILTVVYVHMPPYDGLYPASPLSLEGIILLTREMLGRSSVPLLTIVSGFLAFRLAGHRDWSGQTLHRVMTLLAPLLLWNLIALAKDAVLSGGAAIPSIASLPRELLGLPGFPHLAPLYFLRDLFLCSMATPILLFALRRWLWPTLLILLLDALFDLDGPVLTQSVMLLYFALGLALGTRQIPSALASRHLAPKLLLSAVLVAAAALVPFYTEPAWETSPAGILGRQMLFIGGGLGGALGAWALAGAVLRHAAATRWLKSIEPLMFFLFCAHPILIGAAWLVVQALGGATGTLLHAIFFFTGPLLMLIGSYVAVWILTRIAPKTLGLLLGGRAPDRAQLKAMLPGRTPVAANAL